MLDTAALILGAALLAPTAALLATLLARETRAEFLIATLIVAAAIVVGSSILLSLVHLLTRDALLVAEALWLSGAVLVWRSRGRPRPPSFRPPRARVVARAARAHPLVTFLLTLAVLTLAFQAVLAVTVAPNEYDSLGYHLPRAAFWLQHHSALQYNPGALDDPEQAQPPNAELLVAWTMALTRSDRYAQLVQWLALMGLLATLYAGTRLVGFARSPALFVVGLFALLPDVQLESVTVQNDIVLAFLLGSGLLFAVRGIRMRSVGRLALAALAAGLAIGTKYDTAFALPATALIVGASVRANRPPRCLVLQGAGLLAVAAIGLGSFIYIQNLVGTQTLTGFSGTLPGDWVKTNPLADTVHNAWDMIDAEWLPQPRWIARPVQHLADDVFADVRGADFQVPPDPAINNDTDADTSAYGLVGLLLLLPALLLALVRRRTPWPLRILALASVSYFFALTVVLGYSDETGRFLMPAVVLAMPLLAPLARRWWSAVLAVALVLATLPGTLLHDDYKPVLALDGQPSVFQMNRLEQQTVDNDLSPLEPALARLFAMVGKHEALGFLQQDNFPEYLLFGEPLQRRLVGFDPPVTPQELRAAGVRGMFIAFNNQPPCVDSTCLPPTRGLRFTALGGGSYFVTLAPAR